MSKLAAVTAAVFFRLKRIKCRRWLPPPTAATLKAMARIGLAGPGQMPVTAISACLKSHCRWESSQSPQ